ncbi:MAG: Delta(1)-pyrroline-2-carboxylate reductase [Anaerolineae bacterium]|nr:Delta(1)-pyrroline-2-carboxylate reductase [Anaerolineae bacterium]
MTQILYLSRADVERVGVTMREIIDAVENGFREHGEGRVEMPPKPGIHTMPDSFIHAMPAYIPALRAAGVKWVSGYPENQKRGLPYITGLLILNDTETGIPLAVMDCTWITAMRTGAATAVAAKYLARAEASSVGILGCGVQGTSNLQALAEQFSLRRVAVFDAVTAQAERLANFARENFGLETVIAKTARDAVDGVDLAVTAGPLLHTPHATIQKDWLNAGAFASLVDFDSYWHPDALKQADKFCTDDVPQYEHYRALGYFQNMPPIYATVGELVAGKKRGRENANEITMTCNLGLAIDDMATAPLVYARARERGIGVWLEL